MGITFDIIKNEETNIDREFLIEIRNKIMIDKLIELIDKIDDIIGDEEAYLNKKLFFSLATKFLNNNQLEKTWNLFCDLEEKAIKFELYSLFIMVSKASFEAKIHTIFNLFCINDEKTLKACDFILLIKSVLNSVYKVCKVDIPTDDEYLEFLKSKCAGCLYNEDFEINFEDFYDFVSGEEEIQNFLIENFDIQTRFHAMKSYIKYLN